MEKTILTIAVVTAMSLTAVQTTSAAFAAKVCATENITDEEVTHKIDASILDNGTKTIITLNLGHIDGSLEADGVLLVIDGKIYKPHFTRFTESNGEKYLRLTFGKLKRTDGATLSFMLNGKTRVMKIRESGVEEIIASGVCVR